MPSSFCTICPQYGKGFVPCCATLRGLVSTGSAGCSCTGAGGSSAADGCSTGAGCSGWLAGSSGGGACGAGSSHGRAASLCCTGGSSGMGGSSSAGAGGASGSAGCGGICCTAGAGSSTAAGVWGVAAAGAGCTGALTKGCTAAAKGRGASGCAARAGAACTVTACICWGGSDRLNSASSSSMRWSLPRVMCSSAVPNVRMARMASRCPISGPFCRYSASSSGETPDSSACPPGSAASIRAR